VRGLFLGTIPSKEDFMAKDYLSKFLKSVEKVIDAKKEILSLADDFEETYKRHKSSPRYNPLKRYSQPYVKSKEGCSCTKRYLQKVRRGGNVKYDEDWSLNKGGKNVMNRKLNTKLEKDFSKDEKLNIEKKLVALLKKVSSIKEKATEFLAKTAEEGMERPDRVENIEINPGGVGNTQDTMNVNEVVSETPQEVQQPTETVPQESGEISVNAVLKSVSDLVGAPFENISVETISIDKATGRVSLTFTFNDKVTSLPVTASLVIDPKEASIEVKSTEEPPEYYTYDIPTRTLRPLKRFMSKEKPTIGREDVGGKKDERIFGREDLPKGLDSKGETVFGRETFKEDKKKTSSILVENLVDQLIAKEIIPVELKNQYRKVYATYDGKNLKALSEILENMPEDAQLLVDDDGVVHDLREIV